MFRLITPSQSYAIYSRTTADPYFWNHPAGGVYNDQYFSFVYEDCQIDGMEFDFANGKVISSEPRVLANQALTNDTSTTQEMTFQLTQIEEHNSMFEFHSGFPIAINSTIRGKLTFNSSYASI